MTMTLFLVNLSFLVFKQSLNNFSILVKFMSNRMRVSVWKDFVLILLSRYLVPVPR